MMADHSSSNYVIGFDYGTNSCRAVLMRSDSSEELAKAVFAYPSGQEGVILDASDIHLARQNPDDYLAGITHCVKAVVKIAKKQIAGFDPAAIVGIGFATTGSTVIPVDVDLNPLSRQPEFSGNKNALAWLWKDHTSEVEARQLTSALSRDRPDLIARCGGKYSSEWFWAKIMRLKSIDPAVFEAAGNFLELCEFLPLSLSKPADGPIGRSICALGHKALYVEALDGLPDREFLDSIDAELGLLRERLHGNVMTADRPVGTLRPDIAQELGLSCDVVLAGGAFDAHVGAVGAGIRPGRLIKIMGTSTCDIMISPDNQIIPGICGIFEGSVLPGFMGIEAGQSAVGDLFKWFVQNLVPARYGKDDGEKFSNLTDEAATLRPGQSGLVALDWHNGNRTVLVDMDLNGLVIGQTLQTTAAEIYRALIEATAFGALTIIRRLEEHNVAVDDIICCGGLPQKNPVLMQIYADVTGRPISVARSQETCAKGSAIFAAAAAGLGDLDHLRDAMIEPATDCYQPDAAAHEQYGKLFEIYTKLHGAFGESGQTVDLFGVMKELNAIRRDVLNG